MTKISKDLEWLDEYLYLASTVVPKIKKLKAQIETLKKLRKTIKKLKRIKKISPREGKICRIYGALTHQTDGYYTMTLYVKYNSIISLNPKPKFRTKVFSKVDILSTFAHELAHLMHWDHTPQHKMLEAKLTMLFMARLAENGYVSEEDEHKNRRTIDAEHIHRREQ